MLLVPLAIALVALRMAAFADIWKTVLTIFCRSDGPSFNSAARPGLSMIQQLSNLNRQRLCCIWFLKKGDFLLQDAMP